MPVTFSYAARAREATIANLNHRLATGDFMGAPSFRTILQKKPVRGVKGRAKNVRQMIMDVGNVGSFNVELLIPQAFLMARTTDPDAQATILTVEGIQRAINKISAPGVKVDVNGLLTPETVQALRVVSGASWMSKTWVQIYGDLAEMINRKLKLPPPGGQPTGDVLVVGDAFTTVPAAVLLGGAALLFLAFR